MMTSRHCTIHTIAVVLVAVGILVAGSAPATAYDGYVAPIQEIPFARTTLTGARALGMGGVALATADDGSAMLTNPAALARLRRVELSGGFSFESRGLSGEALGGDFETDLTSTNLSALRFAYPFPTFRGSLVVGVGIERVYGLDADFLSTYDDSLTWYEPSDEENMTDVWSQTEDLLSSGDIYAGTIAAAFDASENVSLGAAVSFVGGTYQRTFLYTASDAYGVSDDYSSYRLEIDSEADVAGLGFKLGSLFYLTEQLAAGATVTLPTALSFSGTESERRMTTGAVENDETVVTTFEDELTLPFTFGVGASWSPVDLVMVGCDYQYTNWSEMEYEGRVYLGDQTERRDAYEATHDLNVGVEVTVPEMPVRVRGGYMSRPVAYQGLTIDTDRSYWTLGAGILIDTVFAIDVAYLAATHERSAEDYDYSETVDDTALIIEAAYRF